MSGMLWGIFVLIIALWFITVVLTVCLWQWLQKQRLFMRYLVSRFDRLEEKISVLEAPVFETKLSIQKDEPISKYESVTLPDDIDIDFVERS